MNKKISFLLPNLKAGGAEKVAILLANEFVVQGYQVNIVLLKATGDLLPFLDTRINIVNLNAERIRQGFKPLLKYLKLERPDALVALMWPLTIMATSAFRIARLPGTIVVSDHTTFSKSPLMTSQLKRLFFKLSVPIVYPLAYARLAVSEGVAHDLAKFGLISKNSITIIHNPINLKPQLFDSQQQLKAWKNFQGKKIVAVGSLKWAKNYPLLLEAFSVLLLKQKAKLIIVGQGELYPKLKLQAHQLGIEQHVDFIGFSNTPQAWMASADLLVLSSHYEGLPSVLIESLAVGTPVVSTNCKSGPKEILEDGKYGKLVPVNDINALAKAMYDSLHEEHDIEALKNRAQDFSIEKIANQYLDLMFPERVKPDA